MKILHDILLSISAGQKTGNLIIIAKDGLSKRAGTCVFNQGKLIQITFQHQTGRAALSELLDRDIHEVNFMEFPITAEPHPDTPTTAELIQQIEAKSQVKKTSNIHLQSEALQLLVARFGASAVAKVDAIAQNISPDEQPIAFLDKCVSLVAVTLGKAKAEKIFAELYEKVRDQRE